VYHEKFRDDFVNDWISQKNSLMRSNKNESDEIKERERGIKRKAMLMAASNTPAEAEDDDLYDMDDILLGGSASKVPKLR
jgi:hypothetical protein